MITSFKMNQNVTIYGTTYTVTGMVAYEQSGWTWKEYQLQPPSGPPAWLSVEVDDGETEFLLYTPCPHFGNMQDSSINYQGYSFNHYESGTAFVSGYFGDVDVDRGEAVTFRDYYNSETNTYLSIENWDGEMEYTYGRVLDPSSITVSAPSAVTPQTSSFRPLKHVKRFVFVLTLIFLAAGLINAFGQKKISSYLKDNEHYTYVTSISSKINNAKARVYSTDYSLDNAVQDIIKHVPNQIDSVVYGTDEEGNEVEDGGIGILGSNEYAYVYEDEEGKTCIQISSDSFMDSQTTAYHANSRSNFYYHTYSSRRRHSTYTATLNSARESSVYSRSSSGGGTSVGK